MLFRDRQEAGKLLAERLRGFRADSPIVLAVPRGGVVVAAEVARTLGAPLGIVVTRKLGAPGNPELAIGAMAPDGEAVLYDGIARQTGASPEYIERERKQQWAELARRIDAYEGLRGLGGVSGRTVIVVDDGVATGATTKAALRWIRKGKPRRLVLAVPVGARESLDDLRGDADEVISLATPEQFWSVGAFYRDWSQVSDQEVAGILSRAASLPGPRDRDGT